MKMSGGVEWALHCCVVLTVSEEPVPAARPAELHEVSSSYLAKQLQALSRAGIIQSVQGKAGGYALTRPPQDLTVLDIAQAVDGPGPAFVCTEIRQRGPLAATPEVCTAPCAIARAMATAEDAWRAALAAVTIAGLAQDVTADYDAPVMSSISNWLSNAAS